MNDLPFDEREKLEIQRELLKKAENLCKDFCRENVAEVVGELENTDVFGGGETL